MVPYDLGMKNKSYRLFQMFSEAMQTRKRDTHFNELTQNHFCLDLILLLWLIQLLIFFHTVRFSYEKWGIIEREWNTVQIYVSWNNDQR